MRFTQLYHLRGVLLFYGEILRKCLSAKAMKLSAKDLLELEIIDETIKEPHGGAHRDRN